MPDEPLSREELLPTHRANLLLMLAWVIFSVILFKVAYPSDFPEFKRSDGLIIALGEITGIDPLYVHRLFIVVWGSITAMLAANTAFPQSRIREWNTPTNLKRSALSFLGALSFTVTGLLFGGWTFILSPASFMIGMVFMYSAVHYPSSIATRRGKFGFALITFLVGWFLGSLFGSRPLFDGLL